MEIPDDEFLQELLATFRVEADEHLQALSSGLLELEKKPPGEDRTALLEIIFREAHSLKGAARAVSLSEIEAICQEIENTFAAWKRQELQPDPEQFTKLHHALDVIGQLLSPAPGGPSTLGNQQLSAQLDQLSRIRTPASRSPEVPPPQPPPELPSEAPSVSVAKSLPAAQALAARENEPLADTVRINTAKLDALLLQAEETLALKLNTSQRTNDLHEIEALLDEWAKHWTRISPEIHTIRHHLKTSGTPPGDRFALSIGKTTGFFDWSQARFKALQDIIHHLTREVEHDQRMLAGMVDNLLNETKKLLMLPFSILMGVLPRLIRDLAFDQGKQVQLLIRGSDVEIDKRILEELKDPLIHLLRNCVDHGIEKPDERQHQGKPKLANVSVTINQLSGSEVEILIADDGAGIDIAAVKASAVNRGLLTAADAERLSDIEAAPLIFQSGVSTSPIVTEISGRGLGLAIVSEKVSNLNGHISVDFRRNAGTTFRILLPLTLATFKGVIVTAGNQHFVLPTANLERVKRIQPNDVKTVENRETITLGRRAVSLVSLAEVLAIHQPPPSSDPQSFPALVLRSGDTRIAFRVDEVLNEQEVLVKPLGKPLVRVRNIAGATVLGSGQAVPILNAADLLKSAAKASGAPTPVRPEITTAEPKSLLLVEDSITARMLLTNILETAGYFVKTAVDGLDAWTTLKMKSFDTVVTDVDMPRMDGIELTRKIRADEHLQALPVVLVTGRESRKDRERGIDAGANAYIVKSSFDQSNLLETIARLV